LSIAAWQLVITVSVCPCQALKEHCFPSILLTSVAFTHLGNRAKKKLG